MIKNHAKCQAWLPDSKVMIQVTGLEFDNEQLKYQGYVIDENDSLSSNGIWGKIKASEDFTVIRDKEVSFTGQPTLRWSTTALDGFGKEIYDWDIIKNPDLGIGLVLWSEKNYAWMIRFNANSTDSFDTLMVVKCHLHQKIGNLFRNPELL